LVILPLSELGAAWLNRIMKHRIAVSAVTLITALAWQSPSLGAGDPKRGQTLFAVCTTCHGSDAKGQEDLNAPALAGRETWYIIRQLENFKTGIRGSNPQDIYGLQMAPMAQLLPDKQAMEDVAAYLSSLPK
jgi:cytochrome c553